MWVKEDPADLNKDKGVSSELKKELSKFDDVYKAYDTLLYSVYKFDENEERNVDCFLHHLVLYGLERGGEFQKGTGFEKIASKIQEEWIKNLFKNPTPDDILNLLKDRHYVICRASRDR